MNTTFFFTILFLGSILQAKDFTICPTCEVKTPQEAYALAADNDRLLIQGGRYLVNGWTIDKSLDLIGSGDAILDGQNVEGHILQINKPNVKVMGLHFIKAGQSTLNDFAAIYVNETDNCHIANNVIEDSFFGIYIAASKSCTILNNKILGPNRVEFQSGNAIHVWKGEDISIIGNEARGHRDGIYLEFVSGSRVVNNFSHNNQRYGLHFMFSNKNEFQKNRFVKNSSGVAVMYSKGILMEENQFTESWGPAAYGLLLKDISDSQIKNNLINHNTVGIFMEASNRSQYKENDFLDNGWALRILGSCEDNAFFHNVFKNNTFDLGTNSTSNSNQFRQNYWSAYEGYDLNRDGLGDIPYRPVRLSSIMMEKFGLSFLLIKSLFLTLADKAENFFPTLTPENLKDDQPLMREISL